MLHSNSTSSQQQQQQQRSTELRCSSAEILLNWEISIFPLQLLLPALPALPQGLTARSSSQMYVRIRRKLAVKNNGLALFG
jgi:invasion protein IalB